LNVVVFGFAGQAAWSCQHSAPVNRFAGTGVQVARWFVHSRDSDNLTRWCRRFRYHLVLTGECREQ
jgi:hypothetical protein